MTPSERPDTLANTVFSGKVAGFAKSPATAENTEGRAPVVQSNRLSPTLVLASASMKKPKPTEDEELLKEAHARFKTVVTSESEWRRKALEELRFVDELDHWSAEMKQERKGRPCLVFDRIGPAIKQVVNNARQDPMEARIVPVGSGVDVKEAEALQGLIRNIAQDSRSDIVTMTAYKHAVKIGRGWWRVNYEYESDNVDELMGDPKLFEQKITLIRVSNPFSVYPDPAAIEFDYSDMRYGFVTETLDKDTFEEIYGGEHTLSSLELGAAGDKPDEHWFPKGQVRIAEYWYVTEEKSYISLMEDGTVVSSDMVRDQLSPEGAPLKEISKRRVVRRRVHGAKITGSEVLEKWDWAGKYIPLIPVLGEEILVDGKRQLRGMIRAAIDANLSYDYMRSKQVEAVGLAPLAPFLVAEGQLEGHEHKWGEANRKAYAYLEYKTVDSQGNPAPMPQRNNAEPAIQAITIAVQHADNDIKATTETFDASLGAPGPEQSGRAIISRQRQADNAHFDYHDNLAIAWRHTTRVILDLAPHVYSDERMLTILDPDGSASQVQWNKQFTDQDGIKRFFKIENASRCDVTISSGPSYASRRQQGADALMELTRTMPQPMSRALDIVVKGLDIPRADTLADRLRPPDIAPEGEAQIPPQVQQQMAQAQEMIKMLTAEVTRLTEVVKTKQIDNESKERIAAMQAQVNLIVADLKTGSQNAQSLMMAEFGAIKHQLDLLQEKELAAQAAQQGQGGPTQSGAPPQPAPQPVPDQGTQPQPQ